MVVATSRVEPELDRRAHAPGTAAAAARDGAGVDVDVVAERAASGDDAALDALLVALRDGGLVRAAAARVVFDPDLVDEVVQDTLVSVAGAITTWRRESAFSTFVTTIARRRAVDALRRRRQDLPFVDVADPPSTALGMSTVIAAHDHVERLLAVLPRDVAEAVRLRDVDGLAYADIASRVGAPASTCRSRVAVGRARLAAHLARGEP